MRPGRAGPIPAAPAAANPRQEDFMAIAGHPTQVGERVVSKAEERRVIIASSVGTVFEWYDFYLYAILAPFFAPCSSHRATRPPPCSARSAPTPRASWCGPFGALIFGRIGDLVGPQVHVPRHDRGHGHRHRARRLPADLRDARLRRPAHPRRAPARAGPGPRRRVRRRRDLRRRARPGRQARLRDGVDPDDRHRGHADGPDRDRDLPLRDGRAGLQRTGAGGSRSGSRSRSW